MRDCWRKAGENKFLNLQSIPSMLPPKDLIIYITKLFLQEMIYKSSKVSGTLSGVPAMNLPLEKTAIVWHLLVFMRQNR